MPSGVYRRKTGIIGEPPVIKQCKRCGADFKAKAAHADRRVYCSKECMYAGRTEASLVAKECKGCKATFFSQPSRRVLFCSEACNRKNRSYVRRNGSDGWYLQGKTGYIARVRDGKTQLQHRFIVEQHLGRSLMPFENVHHINGVKDDNRLENLEIWITKQPKGQRPADLYDWAVELLDHMGYDVVRRSSPP